MKKFFLGIILIAAVAAAGWKYLPQDFIVKSAAWAGSVLGSAESILQNKISPPDYSGKKDAQTLIRNLKNNLEEIKKSVGSAGNSAKLIDSSQKLLDELEASDSEFGLGKMADKVLSAVVPGKKPECTENR